MKIVELKYTIAEIKSSWMPWTVTPEAEVTEDGVNELEDRSIEFTWYEKRESWGPVRQ